MLLPDWKRPIVNGVLLEEWEWQAIRLYKNVDRRHLRGSSALAEMTHCIGNERGHNKAASMCWTHLEQNFPREIPLFCAMSIQSNCIIRCQTDGDDIDYASYTIAEDAFMLEHRAAPRSIRTKKGGGYIETAESTRYAYSVAALKEDTAHLKSTQKILLSSEVKKIWKCGTDPDLGGESCALADLLLGAFKQEPPARLMEYIESPLFQRLAGNHTSAIQDLDSPTGPDFGPSIYDDDQIM